MKKYGLLLCVFFFSFSNGMLTSHYGMFGNQVSLFKMLEKNDNLITFKNAIKNCMVNVNERNENGIPILWHLISGYWDYCGTNVLFTKQSWLEAIDLLLSHGASVRSCTRGKKTLLHEAALIACSEVIEKLLNKKMKVNAQDINGNTPLHFLFKGDLPKIHYMDSLEKLMQAGAKINIQNNNLCTPLHIAAYTLNEEQSQTIIPHLLLYGANLSNQDRDGYTAYSWANSECAKNMLESEQSARNVVLKEIPWKSALKGNMYFSIRNREITSDCKKSHSFSYLKK